MKTKGIKKTIFSSDSSKYISLAKKYGCKNVHHRSKKFSTDNASEYSVFKNFVDIQIKEKKMLPKYFIHLRTTSPIRKKNTLEKAIRFFKKKSSFSSMRSAHVMGIQPIEQPELLMVNYGIVGKNFNIDNF